jgi:D-alanyl-lipoteichoic acid acyltransferase DltB (MBOAT superfamily)
MLFNTIEFWIFFGIVLVLFYSLPFRFGKLVLLVASYYFYMRWDPRFALLILASTVLDYFLGIAISTNSPLKKRRLLIVSIAANLSFLGFFKYYNFFISSFATLFGISEHSVVLQIVLPVGISFYTFKSMSYTIDVYHGWLKPVYNFLDYALFVVFFPELVAGPIVRADVFFPQLFDWKSPTALARQSAIYLIIFGLIKKMVFADRFAAIADEYFGHLDAHPGAVAAWTGVGAFALQIFFDFSGYTDIARGCALLLGFKFPLNFARPYLATNITEFWKRWHMSLSQWLRDYLYIPLGGNRFGKWLTYRNLMLTMLLGGLWHGASWTFVLWGGYQGALLLGHRVFTQSVAKTRAAKLWESRLLVPAKVALTMVFVLIGWVFFRAVSFHDSTYVLEQMFSSHWRLADSFFTTGIWVLFGVATVIALAEEFWHVTDRLCKAPSWCVVPCYVVCFFCLELFAVTGATIPFIYYQF